MLLTPLEVELLEVGRCRHPEWITICGGRLGPVDFPATCALLRHPRLGAVLFDTGYAGRFHAATATFPEQLYRWTTPVDLAPAEHLLAQLTARGLSTADVRAVIVSHLHADHVAGLRDFPAARILVSEEALAAARAVGRLAGLRSGLLPALLPEDLDARAEPVERCAALELGPAFAPFSEARDLLGDGSVLGLPLPGHAAGQLGVLVRDRRAGLLLLAADAAWSGRAIREGRLPAGPARLITHEWRAYRRTLGDLGALAARRPDLSIVPSHCPASAAAFREAQARGDAGG